MDPHAEKRDLVVKVKYGDTLRRFGTCVHDPLMDLDINKLRSKIINLFNFSSDADLILTYTDEDGDVITLVNDDELCDAIIRQYLNPLRINVQLKPNNAGMSDIKTQAGNINPITASFGTGTQPPLNNSALDNALKSVPEPLRSALSKITHDFMSKAAASTPVLTEFVEYFSKLGLLHVGQLSNVTNGAALGTSSGVPAHPVDLNVHGKAKASIDLVSESTVLPNASSFGQTVENNLKPPASGNLTQGVGIYVPPSVDHNQDIYSNSLVSWFPSMDELANSMWTAKENVFPEKEDSDCNSVKAVVFPTQSTLVPNPPSDQTVDHNPQNFEAPKAPVPRSYADVLVCNGSTQFSSSTAASAPQFSFNPQSGSNRHIDGHAPDVFPLVPPIPYRRAYDHHDNMLRTFHRGVQCDGCGMHPIMGPRFKSNVKWDYDLCSFCFSEMGNEADYTRIDRAPYRSPRPLKEVYNPHKFQNPLSHSFRGYGMRPSRAKLESRFIKDLTVPDETLMAPSTPFTKIWRMRNNGTTAWPARTQLVWIGGDQFADRGSVELEIPVNGCLVDEEIDIAVDFKAPSRSGRYISYWRLASPSGQKFGQRVWVIIQVDNSRPNYAASTLPVELNLNLPPGNSGGNELGVIDVNAEPTDGLGPCESDLSDTNVELAKPLVEESRSEIIEYPQVDGLLGVDGGFGPQTPEMAPSALHSIIDWSTASSNAPPVALAPPSGVAIDDHPVEQTLLKELEEMGFKQIDLNKEVLRLNEYDLEQSLDDLCGVADWDPILEELQEMGFCDKEMNKKLLVKNGGSIKRVVLDLITGEKAEYYLHK